MKNSSLAFNPATSAPAIADSSVSGNPTFQCVGDLMDALAEAYRVENSQCDFQSRVQTTATQLIHAADEDPDAAIACLHLVRKGAYSVWHSVHAAIVTAIAGRFIGWSAAERISACCAALTMNIGMHDLQDELYCQKAPLTDAQRTVIHQHPTLSADILRAAGVFDPIWLEAVEHHHEDAEGEGYPYALVGAEISVHARVLHLADVYCAQVSSRLYRPSALSEGVMMKMFEDRGCRLGRNLAYLFLKAVGGFPAGTAVELENGDIAVVVRQGDAPRSAYQPLVRSVMAKDGTVYERPPLRDTELPQYGIEAVKNAPPRRLPYALETLWGELPA